MVVDKNSFWKGNTKGEDNYSDVVLKNILSILAIQIKSLTYRPVFHRY